MITQLISFFTKILHYLPGEISHFLALKGLNLFYKTGLLKRFYKKNFVTSEKTKNKNLWEMSNKLGFAAGLDKNGDYIDSLALLGVGFIELGTVTPRPQSGNPTPRLFRNLKERSLLNRLGFNNKGVDHIVKRLKERESNVVIGTSIGKNFDTPNEMAHEDYLLCLEKVYGLTDYIAVNLSSPNTKDLRELTKLDYLLNLLSLLKSKQMELSAKHGYKSIFIKVSPDESDESLSEICRCILESKLDGIICSNTTIDHEDKNGPGGLSGAPLKEKATKKLKFIKDIIGTEIHLIASGGVMTPEDYQEKLEAGADLVQIYTGFIFEGPKLIEDITNLPSS